MILIQSETQVGHDWPCNFIKVTVTRPRSLGCEVPVLCACVKACVNLLICLFWGFVYEHCRALSGMCRSICKCLLLKQTGHLSLTRPELHHHTPWNLKPDAGSWTARVIRGTHHAGGVTVWLRCPIRHTTERPRPTPAWTNTPVAALSLGRSQAARGPLYRSLYGSHGSNLSIRLRRLL